VECGSGRDLFGFACDGGGALGGGEGDGYESGGDEGLAAGAGEGGVECGEHRVDSFVVEGFGYEVGCCGGGVGGGVEVVRIDVVVEGGGGCVG